MSDDQLTHTYFGVVAKVIDDFSVVINKGSDDGVSVNDRFLIYGVGEEIKDPETGESLGSLESVRGTARVTHVQPKLATLKSDQFEKPIKTVRQIKRTDPYSAFLGKLAETVEEIDENPDRVALEHPQACDRVRPI